MDYTKGRQKLGYDVDDEIAVATAVGTALQAPYIIGAAAYASDPAGLPGLNTDPPIPGNAGFVAQRVTFYATTDTYVRLNGPLRVPHLIPANTWVTWEVQVYIVYYFAAAVAGTLYIRSEG